MSKKKAYVIGTNVSTSLSPFIFQYWFKKYNIDWAEYGFIEIIEENFDKEIKTILKKDGLVGLNVTIPYKEKIISYIDNVRNPIKETHLSNTKSPPINCLTIKQSHDINYSGFKIIGQNTDGIGFEEAVLHQSFFYEQDCCAIVLGYGGASKAIIDRLIVDSNFKRIIVFNRTFNKIKNIKKTFNYNKEVFDCEIESYNIEELAKHTNKAHLIVNTTPINILGNTTEWQINPKCYGFDIVYRPWEGTGFLENFQEINRIEGIYMLVYQAAPCFKEWFGVAPEINDKNLFNALFKKMKEK